MKTVKGNLLDVTSGIIVHQVNNRHVMGAGLALQIRNKYPQHYRDYMAHSLQMGGLVLTHISNKLGIAGLVAQDGYGRDKRYTDYEAFDKSLSTLSELLIMAQYEGKVYFPFGIGCGLAGGKWVEIQSIIEKYFPNAIVVML